MNKSTRWVAASCMGLGLILTPYVSHAQAVYGAINGTVTDNTGAVVPNATVTVTDESKGTSVTAQSNDSGEFSVGHLIPDQYDVKVTATGFETYETQHLQVSADTTPKVDAKLTVGGASQTVQVSADSIPQLKTDRADVSTVFDTKTVSDIPVPNRNFTALQLLLPGAQQLGWGHAASENPQQSAQIQIDGQAFGGVAFELDGTDNQDPILGIIVINPNLDAVTEAKITTQNFDAEVGKAVSSVVTSVTKSGSNSFHGSAFDYRQSNARLARNPFTQFNRDATTNKYIPEGLYNQFGGSIGGPIKKDKVFFFGDYQGLRQKVGVSANQTVPSPHLIATCLGQQATVSGIPGCDFSEYAAAGVNGAGNPVIYQPNGIAYPGQVIPAAQVSPQALGLFKLLQPYQPNKSGKYGLLSSDNYAASGTGLFNNDTWDERVDWQASQKLHVFERFSRFTDTLTGKTLFGAAGGAGFGINNFGGTSVGANDSLAAGADYALSSNLLTDFRVGYYRYNIVTSKYDQNVAFASQLGIPGLNTGTSFTNGAPSFKVTDVGSFGGPNNPDAGGSGYGSGLNVTRCNCPLTEKEDQGQIVNNWTKIFGNHQVKFGTDLRYARNLRVPSDNNRAGELQFATGPTAQNGTFGGLGFATLALGDVTNLQRYVSSSTNAKEFQKRLFFYGQDTWRPTPALTVNYGLRWELYYPEVINSKGQGAVMDLATGYLNVAGVGGVKSNMNYTPGWKALAPRLGIAYQLNPKTVIRSGYGRSFDLGVFGSIFGHVATQNLPVLQNQTLSQTGGPGSSVFNLSQGPSAPVAIAVPASGLLPAPGYAVTPKARPNPLRLPTIDAWNLSIQRSITPTLSLTMAYVGNKGSHTLGAGDGNNTNPNEAGIFLPAQYSITGAPLHYDPSVTSGIALNGGTQNNTYLSRYYGGSLPACSDPNYATPTNEVGITPGRCGWTNGISYYADNLDSHFNALQVSLAKQLTQGLSFNANYAWQRGIDWNSGYSTWSKAAVKGRNNDIREQQIVVYGNYELPFGHNRLIGANVPNVVNEVITGWQISPVLNWSSGLPFTLNYNECAESVPGSAPCYPNGNGKNLRTLNSGYDPIAHNRLFFHGTKTPITQQPFSGYSASALDQIGTNGRNTEWGPNFFNTDLSLQKNVPIHESIFAQFRVDAYNAFNHINAGFGGGGASTSIDGGDVFIGGIAPSQNPTRQLQFSLRLQF